ncbi:MAG TPA: hypothetical protein VIM64_19800 [Puia sp.]
MTPRISSKSHPIPDGFFMQSFSRWHRYDQTRIKPSHCTPTTLTSKKEINIALLSQTRANLIDIWFNKQKHNEQYPNVLLDFHRPLKEKGMFEAYNYWILMKGDEAEFVQWQEAHRDQFDAFAAWFKDNPLQLDTSHYFVRTQYD